MNNPFYLNTYNTPEYFCDRENEVKQLKSALLNGRNTVLISLRRMGKTGLIKHLFYNLSKEKEVSTLYIDIMNTYSIEDFVNKLAESVLNDFTSKSKRLFNKVMNFLSSFNPVITFDSQTGTPSVELKSNSINQTKASIEKILNYIDNNNKRVFIAIDEFQQIVNYKEKGFETFLRSKIQHLKNINFIFSGSERHTLTSMFVSPLQPFYQSADFLKLDRIQQDIYALFIVDKFNKSNRKIAYDDVMDTILWLDTYTYYIQSFFNKLWYIAPKNIKKIDFDHTHTQLLNERDYIYSNMRNLLTKWQYKLLQAIANEEQVEKPTSKEFILKYNLGTASTISSAIKILIDKELIYKENEMYKVYDVFFSKWLAQKF